MLKRLETMKKGVEMVEKNESENKPELVVLDRLSGLTDKQEKVSHYISQRMAQNEAYIKSGYSSNQAAKTIHENASRLMANSKIVARVKALTIDKAEDIKLKRARLESYVLERLRLEAENAESDSARVQSLHLIGKTIGLFVDKVEVEEADSDLQTLENKLKEKLEKLKVI